VDYGHYSLAISHCPLAHDYTLELIVQYTIRVTIPYSYDYLINNIIKHIDLTEISVYHIPIKLKRQTPFCIPNVMYYLLVINGSTFGKTLFVNDEVH